MWLEAGCTLCFGANAADREVACSVGFSPEKAVMEVALDLMDVVAARRQEPVEEVEIAAMICNGCKQAGTKYRSEA